MLAYVDTSTLDGKSLQFHATGPGVFGARARGFVAGAIVLRLAAKGDHWRWSLTGPFLPVALQPAGGEADTLAKAQAAFRAKFEAWLDWAQGAPVMWNEAGPDRDARPLSARSAPR